MLWAIQMLADALIRETELGGTSEITCSPAPCSRQGRPCLTPALHCPACPSRQLCLGQNSLRLFCTRLGSGMAFKHLPIQFIFCGCAFIVPIPSAVSIGQHGYCFSGIRCVTLLSALVPTLLHEVLRVSWWWCALEPLCPLLYRVLHEGGNADRPCLKKLTVHITDVQKQFSLSGKFTFPFPLPELPVQPCHVTLHFTAGPKNKLLLQKILPALCPFVVMLYRLRVSWSCPLWGSYFRANSRLCELF